MPNLALITNFDVTTIAFSYLFLLVISMVSILSTYASKHFYSFAHCPYQSRKAHIIACYHNTHHPHHFRPTWYKDTNPICYKVAMLSPLPWGWWVYTNDPHYPGSHWLGCHQTWHHTVSFLPSSSCSLLFADSFSPCYKRQKLHLGVYIAIENNAQQ